MTAATILVGVTGAQAGWSFAVLGDTRGNDDGQDAGVSPHLNAIARKIASLTAHKPAFVLVNGDLISGELIGSTYANFVGQFNTWKRAMKPVVAANIPIYPVRGNHENEIVDFFPPTAALKQAYYDSFGANMPTNGPNNGPDDDQRGFSYSFVHRNLTVVVVDQYFYYNQYINLSPQNLGYHSLDQQWVVQQLQTDDTPYKLVMVHEPAFITTGQDLGEQYFGTEADGLQRRAEFWNALGNNGCQLYVCGHVHGLSVASVAGEAGNRLYQMMTGNGGAAPLDSLQANHEAGVDVLYTNGSNFGFALATVGDEAMTIEYYLLNTNNNSWSKAAYTTTIPAVAKFAGGAGADGRTMYGNTRGTPRECSALVSQWRFWFHRPMKAQPAFPIRIDSNLLATEPRVLDRRAFLRQSLACAGGLAVCLPAVTSGLDQGWPKPIGVAKGTHPGRVVWVHDPEVTDWKGPDDGHWWEGKQVKQARVDAMMARSICELTGEAAVAKAWPRLFRHLNRARGKGDVGYSAGERIVIKPNWVGMIFREGNVNLDTYAFIRRHDYMNTAPQMILALISQLASVGVPPQNITVCDTLACLVHDYYDLLHGAFSAVRYEDYAGKFERFKVKPSSQPLHWSSRPQGKAQDYLPACFAEAQYLINFANLKAHTSGGVTLCAKNHLGSLIRWPVQQGYYDIHPNCFAKDAGIYRPLVDLTGHSHLGGKTVLYLVDGLFSGVHPRDPVPQRMQSAPFKGQWSCSLLASQDPLAIDSVGFDFLSTEWPDIVRKGGVDDYLHEAALANDPPSGTFYDPDHATATQRLPSLGVHEHWNDAQVRKYSRNLGTGEGIELVCVKLGSRSGK